MERRFAVRYEELMAEAEVKPEAMEGVLQRLDEFVKPFAASLKHDAQRQHAAEYVVGLVSNVKRKNIETIATNRHWSMRGCICPRNGRKTNDVAGKRESPRKSSFARGMSLPWR